MEQYVGEIKIFLKNKIPKEFLICNGQEVFINEFPRLYMVIGCQYGGDETIRFKLPEINCVGNSNVVFCIATEGARLD